MLRYTHSSPSYKVKKKLFFYVVRCAFLLSLAKTVKVYNYIRSYDTSGCVIINCRLTCQTIWPRAHFGL